MEAGFIFLIICLLWFSCGESKELKLLVWIKWRKVKLFRSFHIYRVSFAVPPPFTDSRLLWQDCPVCVFLTDLLPLLTKQQSDSHFWPHVEKNLWKTQYDVTSDVVNVGSDSVYRKKSFCGLWQRGWRRRNRVLLFSQCFRDSVSDLNIESLNRWS